MPADRLLGTLLRSLQTYTDQQDTPRLLGTGVSLLTSLNNPLNVTLLTSQLLSASALWTRPEGLKTSYQCLSVFHGAAQSLIRHEEAIRNKTPDRDFERLQREKALPKDDWIKAVVHGADGHSPRWRHMLVFGGLLLGFGGRETETLSISTRAVLEDGLVIAVQKHLTDAIDSLGDETTTLVLNHCFPILSDVSRRRLPYDRLLPIFTNVAFASPEGLQSSYFLAGIHIDLHPAPQSQLTWPDRSRSFQNIKSMLASPLVSSLGPLSRLIAHAVEHVTNSELVLTALDEVEDFATTLLTQWRQTRLCEIDVTDEASALDQHSREVTVPVLWKLLQSMLFCTVIVLRSIVSRSFGDKSLTRHNVAPQVATKVLHTLRSMYFISSRTGAANFSQHNFVSLAAADILNAYPSAAEPFIQSIRPSQLGHVPRQPLERCLDLYFLNTAEHFTRVLSLKTCEGLLIAAATPYLTTGGTGRMMPIFEAAHSVMLAVFAPPRNAELVTRHLPSYVDALFNVFPTHLSIRQFRLAYKSLLRITSPPMPLAISQPLLSATLLEVIYERALHAPTTPIPSHSDTPNTEESLESPVHLSEQAVLTLTILDTLSQIDTSLLEEWLPLSASLVNAVQGDEMREHCKHHFWEILTNGEMDPDRSSVCHAWWSTHGGREHVLYGESSITIDEADVMSGGLPAEKDSKL